MTRAAALALAHASALAAPGAAHAAARFAVIVGSNAGDPARPRLWYAERVTTASRGGASPALRRAGAP